MKPMFSIKFSSLFNVLYTVSLQSLAQRKVNLCLSSGALHFGTSKQNLKLWTTLHLTILRPKSFSE